VAGEDLDEDTSDSSSAPGAAGKKGKKPLNKGQKIGVAIGVVTILLFIYEIKKNSAATAATAASATTPAAAPIDPQTGYPSGSVQDQNALAAINGTSSYANGNSTGGSYGSSGSGSYGGGGGGMSTLQSEYAALEAQLTTLTSDVNGLSTNNNQTTPPPVTTPPVLPPILTPPITTISKLPTPTPVITPPAVVQPAPAVVPTPVETSAQLPKGTASHPYLATNKALGTHAPVNAGFH